MAIALLLLRRLAVVSVVVFVVATITFLVLRVVPGSAVDQLAGAYGTPQQRAETRAALGLDDSLLDQYLTYLAGIVQLDFGRSFFSGRRVGEVLGETVPVTIELAIAAGLLMVVVGVASGVLAAALRGTWADTAIRTVAAVLFSIPWFSPGCSCSSSSHRCGRSCPASGACPRRSPTSPRRTSSSSTRSCRAGRSSSAPGSSG